VTTHHAILTQLAKCQQANKQQEQPSNQLVLKTIQGYDKWRLSLYHLEIMALGIRTLPCLMKYFHFFKAAGTAFQPASPENYTRI